MTCITESQFSYSVHGNIGLDNKQTTLFVCKESYSIGDKQPIVSVECNYTEYKTRYSIGRIHKISLFVWRWLILCRKDGKVKVYEVLSTRYYIASVVELATRGQARLRNWFESNPCLSPSFYKERFPLSDKVILLDGMQGWRNAERIVTRVSIRFDSVVRSWYLYKSA